MVPMSTDRVTNSPALRGCGKIGCGVEAFSARFFVAAQEGVVDLMAPVNGCPSGVEVFPQPVKSRPFKTGFFSAAC
jgi:hypothetical protein